MKNDDIKKKVYEKVEKAKKKVAEKCLKSAKAVLFAVACGGVVLTGCSTADAPTAQRAQSVTAKDITININVASTTNAAAPSLHLEIATAAQANETAGTETMTNSPTQTPTNDVKPDLDFTYGLASTSSAGSDWISDLTVASAKGLAAWLKSGSSNGTMSVTKKDGTTETVTCKDGVCTNAAGDCVNCSPE